MRWLLLWESFLTFATFTTGGLGLTDVIPPKEVAILVLMVQGLNAATIVYKTGTWNPAPGSMPSAPVVVVHGQTTEPPP